MLTQQCFSPCLLLQSRGKFADIMELEGQLEDKDNRIADLEASGFRPRH